MSEVIDRLVNTSTALQAAIGSSGADFAAAEHSLSDRMDDFRSVLDHVVAEINQFNQATRATIDDAGSLAETIVLHRESLAGSAGELSRSQGELDEMLTARRDSLESLITNITERREEFEGHDDVLRGAARGILRESRDASSRHQRIPQRNFAGHGRYGGSPICRYSGQHRAGTRTDRSGVARCLRTGKRRSRRHFRPNHRALPSRGGGTARNMSRDIHKELEATREALRRGAIDLPQETAQQAALMRRAVADQIKALEELSDIVTRSGRGLDVSQPAPLASERAGSQTAFRRAEPAHVAEAPRGPEPQRPEPQKPRPAARPPAAAAKPPERGNGWISDLLARADSEEPVPAPKAVAKATQPAQPLDAFSLDVARLIDHAAVSDAWERHRRGEANAFSRRIYVGRGAQTFDEVRRRYRLDPEFHATIDRYIQEFERLLAELGQAIPAEKPSPRPISYRRRARSIPCSRMQLAGCARSR